LSNEDVGAGSEGALNVALIREYLLGTGAGFFLGGGSVFRVEGSWELRVNSLQGFRVQDKRGSYTRAFPFSETASLTSNQIG
jgi:hypothetical protein